MIITILSTLLGLAFYISRRKKQRKQIRKEEFERIIKGETKLNYSEIYQYVFNYHQEDIHKCNGKYENINYDYFKSLLDNWTNFNKNKYSKNNFEMPLFYKSTWLKSKNDGFNMSLGELILSENKKIRNSLLNKSKDFLKIFGIYDYIEFLKACGKKIQEKEREVYECYKIEEKDKELILHCQMGDYFDFLRSYELIQKEIYYNALKRGGVFKIRETINFSELENFSTRPAKLGLNVLLIMKKDDGYATLIHKRRENLAEYPNFYHVVPAGTFEPLKKDKFKEQYTLNYTIFRELLEEVFGLENAEKEYKGINPFHIFFMPVRKDGMPDVYPCKLIFEKFDESNIGDIIRRTKTEKYEIIPTGFLIDITSFKPELTYMLYIKDPEIWRKLYPYLMENWEGIMTDYDLLSDEFKYFLNEHLNANDIVPAGMVAITEGIYWFEKNILKKC